MSGEERPIQLCGGLSSVVSGRAAGFSVSPGNVGNLPFVRRGSSTGRFAGLVFVHNESSMSASQFQSASLTRY